MITGKTDFWNLACVFHRLSEEVILKSHSTVTDKSHILSKSYWLSIPYKGGFLSVKNWMYFATNPVEGLNLLAGWGVGDRPPNHRKAVLELKSIWWKKTPLSHDMWLNHLGSRSYPIDRWMLQSPRGNCLSIETFWQHHTRIWCQGGVNWIEKKRVFSRQVGQVVSWDHDLRWVLPQSQDSVAGKCIYSSCVLTLRTCHSTSHRNPQKLGHRQGQCSSESCSECNI